MMLRRSFWAVGPVCLACALACGPKDAKVEKAPEVTAQQRAQMAMSYMNAGRVSDALESTEAALAQEPDNPRVHFFAGQIYFRAGRYPRAEEAFLRSLALDPYLTDAHNYLGAVYQESGRPADAEKHYRAALEDPAYPTPEKACLNLGMLYGTQGRDEEALQMLRRAVEYDPKNHQAQFEQAVVLERLGRLDQAIRLYEVARPGYRNSGRYFYRLATAYVKAGRLNEARENLRLCLGVAPGSESAALCSDLMETLN